jgi:hypothetical protein
LAHYLAKPTICIVNDPIPPGHRVIKDVLQRSSVKIFDWSDDFKEFTADSAERESLEKSCEFYCKNTDVVFAINDQLRDRAKAYQGNAYTIRNATNFFTFDDRLPSQALKTPVLAALRPPIIGYIGWLVGARLDEDLIYFLAQAKPEWQFVFMGPRSEPHPLGRKIPHLKNVHLLDPVPYHQLPKVLAKLNVCIIPNKVNSYTRGNDPIKIYDYLASGNPIVSTRTQGVEDFKDSIYIADNKDEFLRYLNICLTNDSADNRRRRQEIGRHNSWQERMESVKKILEPFLKRKVKV